MFYGSNEKDIILCKLKLIFLVVLDIAFSMLYYVSQNALWIFFSDKSRSAKITNIFVLYDAE